MIHLGSLLAPLGIHLCTGLYPGGFGCGACQTLRGQNTEVREAQVSVRDDKGAGGSNACVNVEGGTWVSERRGDGRGHRRGAPPPGPSPERGRFNDVPSPPAPPRTCSCTPYNGRPRAPPARPARPTETCTAHIPSRPRAVPARSACETHLLAAGTHLPAQLPRGRYDPVRAARRTGLQSPDPTPRSSLRCKGPLLS